MQLGKTSKGVKRLIHVSWWKVILGGLLSFVGVIALIVYMTNIENMFAATGAVFTLGPGALLIYWGFSQFKTGYMFNLAGRKPTGRENTIAIFARRNNGKDIPWLIKVVELTNIPRGARLHYVRNWKRHFYEFYNNTATKNFLPVTLPDKPSFPPELFKIPATMSQTKEYMEYAPPTLMQKIAPGILIAVIVIVGVLMMITTQGGGS